MLFSNVPCGWIRTAAALSQKTAQKQPSGLFLAARLATSTRAHQKSSTHECALDFCFGRRFSYYEGAAPCIRPCASCLKIRRSLRKKKKARQSSTDQRAILVGAAGFEPTASSSRTRRATNCAMPRKYRNPMGCGLVGDERIELPQVESESTALPLCKSPLFGFVSRR